MLEYQQKIAICLNNRLELEMSRYIQLFGNNILSLFQKIANFFF